MRFQLSTFKYNRNPAAVWQDDSWRGQWGQVDPLAMKHPDYTPYAYVYNNPLCLIDLFGLDSTIYIRELPNCKLNEEQQQEIVNQVQNVMDKNEIPVKVKYLPLDENGNPQYQNLDKTDVMIDIINDTDPRIKQEKANNPEAEGTSRSDIQMGAVTKDAMDPSKRNNDRVLTTVGLGNVTAHEAAHLMGVHGHNDKPLAQHLMNSVRSTQETNNPIQEILNSDRDKIKNFLKQ